jgi:AraC-like DNA-binding protein
MLIYCLAYFTWDQPVFLIHRMEESSLALENLSPAELKEEPVLHEKGRTSYYLNDTQYQKMALRLEKLLEKKEVYLDPEVTLAQLSEKLEILPYQTSEVISRKYKQTFFDLINNYRIAEIKKRLTDPHYDHFSILAIAMECGFNSKSSFNTAFKKFTGCTPSEFRRNKAADVSVFK